MSSELETIISQAQKLDLPSQAQLISRLTKDAVVNPWLAIAGSLVEDPLFDDYVAEIDRYREELDSPLSEWGSFSTSCFYHSTLLIDRF